MEIKLSSLTLIKGDNKMFDFVIYIIVGFIIFFFLNNDPFFNGKFPTPVIAGVVLLWPIILFVIFLGICISLIQDIAKGK